MTKYVDVHLTMRAYSYQLRAMLGTLLTGLHLGDSKPIKLIPIGLFLTGDTRKIFVSNIQDRRRVSLGARLDRL